VLAAGGNLLLAQAGSFRAVEIYRLLVGFGAAFSYVGVLKLISNWFPAQRFATLAGLTNTLGMIGAIVGTRLFAGVVAQVGWRGSLVTTGILGAVLAVLILLVVRDHPRGAEVWHERPDQERGLAKIRNDLKHVLGMSQFWIVGVYITTMNITFTAVGAVWGPSRIQEIYGINEVQAAGVVSMLFMGGIFGAIFFGSFSDWLRRRKLPMLTASGSALVVMVVFMYGPKLPLAAAYVMMFLQGFACNGLILGYSVAHDIRPPGSAGAAEGFVNTVCAGGTAMFLPIMGWLLGFGVDFARFFLIAALAVAVLMSFLSRETHCQELYASD
jgi:sugar phosphate permease